MINATSVIEHVRCPESVLKAVRETLTPEGVFVFDSPNRYDMVDPEPHVGVRFVGFWPRYLQEPYVRLVSGQEYRGKRLLSLRELVRHLNGLACNYAVFFWPRWQPQRRSRRPLGRFLFSRWPQVAETLNRMWAHFVGVHEVVLWRPREGAVADTRIVGPMPTDVGD